MFVVTLVNGQYQKQFEYTSLKRARKAAKEKLKGQLYYPFAVVTGEGVDELYGKSSSTDVTNDSAARNQPIIVNTQTVGPANSVLSSRRMGLRHQH